MLIWLAANVVASSLCPVASPYPLVWMTIGAVGDLWSSMMCCWNLGPFGFAWSTGWSMVKSNCWYPAGGGILGWRVTPGMQRSFPMRSVAAQAGVGAEGHAA